MDVGTLPREPFWGVTKKNENWYIITDLWEYSYRQRSVKSPVAIRVDEAVAKESLTRAQLAGIDKKAVRFDGGFTCLYSQPQWSE